MPVHCNVIISSHDFGIFKVFDFGLQFMYGFLG